ncbi:hypothetical protein [Roseateles flavus]|uniref:Uncharacterized protein n=1 Tax=Roseateles flavus TaxID=3149041 RepID=A0ABV0G8V3_9BURK
MGMQLTDFAEPLREVAPFKFALDVPPKPHPAFSLYVLQITPKHGLSWIKAIGHDVKTSSYGLELKGAFDAMEGKLKNTYGSSTRNDFLMVDSIWNEPKDWMMALLKNERFLSSVWDAKSGAKLTEAIESIYLGASGSDSDTGYITIEYNLKSGAQADAEIAEIQDEVL